MKNTKIIIALIMIFGFTANANDVVAREPSAAPATLDDLISDLYQKVSSKFDNVKGRVAVMDFPSLDGKVTGLSAYIGNKVGNKLIESNRQVVDRATLDRIFAEQRMQQSALMDTSTAARIGKMAGAAIFVMGGYTEMPSKLSISLRVLSVETGQFIAASEASAPFNPDLKAEAEYLMKKSAPTPTSFSSGSDSAATVDDAKPKASAFDNWLCANIRVGLPLGAVFKKALEYDEYENDDLKACAMSTYTDASGEDGYAIRFDRWYFRTNGNCEIIASSAIKGKIGEGGAIQHWAYTGTTELQNQGDCLPHGSEMWTASRAVGKKKKAKK